MKWGFFKRKKEIPKEKEVIEEKPKIPFPDIVRQVQKIPKKVYLTESEAEWLEAQAIEECTSENSIFRKSLKKYRESIM